MNCSIRLATAEDVPAILDIYAPFVRDTVISFEYDVPDIDAFQQRFSKFAKKFPWFVCEINGHIAGYSYAHQYHERFAYSWSAECSIYVDSKYHGMRIGQALYECLLGALKLQGFMNAFAGVTVPNEKSERLHASFGFEQVGILKNIGFKFGQWRDVALYAKKISDLPGDPKPPKVIWQVSDMPEFESILQRAASHVKAG